MTIYPYGRPAGISRHWQIAAIDLPIPNRLVEDEDKHEWINYLDCLSPAQQMRKAAQAADQFLALLEKSPADLALLSEREQILVYSKWTAMSYASNMLAKRLLFAEGEGKKSKEYPTDMDRNISQLIDFMNAVNSPDVKDWEKRREKLLVYCNEENTPFTKLLGHASRTFASTENRKKAPPPLDEPTVGLETDMAVKKPLKVKHLGP